GEVPGQVLGQLGRSGDDRVQIALAACGSEEAAHGARGCGVTAVNGGCGQEQFAYQRAARCQVTQRWRLQVFGRGAVVAGGQRDLGQQQAAGGGRQPGSQLGGAGQVSQR